MKCTHCNYKWETKSKMVFVSCPSCLLKVRNMIESTNVKNGKTYKNFVKSDNNNSNIKEGKQ